MIPPSFPEDRPLDPAASLEHVIRVSMPGRRRRRLVHSGMGAAVQSRSFDPGKREDLDLLGTLLTAARRLSGGSGTPEAFRLLPSDLRRKIRERRTAYALVFVVDASSSMRNRDRIQTAKGMLSRFLRESYIRRDRVGLVAFRHDLSSLVLPLTSNIFRAERAVEDLPVGGRTPLAEGMALGLRALLRERSRDPESVPVMIIVSDGKPNQSLYGGDPLEEALSVAARVARNKTALVFIDTEDDPLAFGYGPDLARAGSGVYRTMTSLRGASRAR